MRRTVGALWIRLPSGFTNQKFDKFYKALGDNVPQYCQLEGSGAQFIFCIDLLLNFSSLCEEYGITQYHLTQFDIEQEQFNSQHQIHCVYGNKEYELRKIIN